PECVEIAKLTRGSSNIHFGVVGLRYRRLCGKEGRVEADRPVEIRDRYMDMQAFHRTAPFALRRTSRADCGSHTGAPQAALSPAPQFRARKPIRAFRPS